MPRNFERTHAPVTRPAALVADDNPGLCLLTAMMLEGMGFAVMTAADGREAVRLFERHSSQLALVVLDVEMPVLDGVGALRAIRSIDSGVPVVFCSGCHRDDVLCRTQDCPPDGFVGKPFSMEQMERKIGGLLKPKAPQGERLRLRLGHGDSSNGRKVSFGEGRGDSACVNPMISMPGIVTSEGRGPFWPRP